MDISSLIKAVHVRSEYGPDVDLVDPFGPAAPNPYMQKLKPMIVIDTDAGPITIAPYGQPGPSSWSAVLSGLGGVSAVVLGLALYGGYKLAFG